MKDTLFDFVIKYRLYLGTWGREEVQFGQREQTLQEHMRGLSWQWCVWEAREYRGSVWAAVTKEESHWRVTKVNSLKPGTSVGHFVERRRAEKKSSPAPILMATTTMLGLMIKWRWEQVFGMVVKMSLRIPTFHIAVLGFTYQLCAQFQHPAIVQPGRWWWWLK